MTKIVFAALLLLAVVRGASAQTIPGTVNYQGYLASSGGVPVTGSVSMTIGLHNASSGGAMLWTESHTVTVANGVFNVVLGSQGSPLDATLLSQPLYLSVQVNGEDMAPRAALASSPYAFRAASLTGTASVPAVQVSGVLSTANLPPCGNGQVLRYTTSWGCAAGGVTGVTAGTGLTGGTITTTGTVGVDTTVVLTTTNAATKSSGVLTFGDSLLALRNSGGSASTTLSAGSSSTNRTIVFPDVNGTAVTTGNLSSINATGTIQSGTWQGTAIGAQYGGIGINSSSAPTGSVLRTTATGTWASLSPGGEGQVLKIVSGVPQWAADAVSSSLRYKERIADMGPVSTDLMNLRPVIFRYKPGHGHDSLQDTYGLLAEDVAAIYPALVARAADGAPDAIRYHLLAPLLLNELQRQNRTIERQARELEALRGEMAALAATLVELGKGL